MKLTTKQLKQIIREEIENISEMQTHLGLPHVFSGFDLAERLYDITDPKGMGDDSFMQRDGQKIRQMSLNRLVKLRHKLSNEPQGSSEAEHLVQEIDMLEDAIDHYDTVMEDWNSTWVYQGNVDRDNPQYYPVDKTGKTRMLNRRRQQQRSRGNKSYHKTYTKDKGW